MIVICGTQVEADDISRLFFKILIFWFVSGVKMTKNDKNFCLLRVISQEYLFIVHKQKRKYLLFFNF